MALTERLALLVTLDAGGAIKGLESVGRSADRNLGKTQNRLDQLGSKFQKAGAGMLAGAGLAATGLYQAGRAAADLEQAVGGTEAVFKDSSGVIDRWAKNAASKMGLSERAFREATTSLGGQLKGLGFDIDDAADKAIDLTGIAADLAATYGGTTAEAVQALGAAFRGEADPAERFNLFLNQTRVNAKAVELGLAASTSQVSAQAKAQATLALITEQSADAQGQFARETNTASGQMAIASAEFENAKAALGESVAPILGTVAGGLADVARGFTDANEASGGLLSKLATFGTIGLGAAGGLSLILGKVIQLRDSIKDIPARLKSIGDGLGRFKGAAGVAAAGVGIFALAMYKAQQRAEDLRQAARELADEAEATGRTLEEVAVEKLATTFAESDQVSRALQDLGVSFEELRVPLTGSQEDFDRWAASLQGVVKAGGGLGNEANTLISRVGRLRKELGEAQEVTTRTSQATAALGITTADSVGPTNGLANAASGLSGELYGVAGGANAAGISLSGIGVAALDAYTAQIGYERSILNTNEALDGLTGSGSSAGGAIKDFTHDIEEATESVEKARQELADAEAALEEARRPADTRTVEQGEIDIRQAKIDAERATRRVTEAEAKLKKLRLDGGASRDDIREAELDLEDARLAARESTFRVLDAEEKLAEIRQKGTATDANVIQAEKRVKDAHESVSDAQYRLKEVTNQSTQASGGFARTQGEMARAVLDAKSKLIDEAEALADFQVKMREANGEVVTADDKQRIFIQALDDVAGRLSPGSPLRQQLEAFIQQLKNVPRDLRIKFGADVAGAFQTVEDFIDYLNNIDKAENASGHTILLGVKQEQLQGRASGGPVVPRTAYVVGEWGPELFVPSTAGTVIPNGAVRAAPTSGGGTDVIEEHIHLNLDGREVAEVIRRHERSLR